MYIQSNRVVRATINRTLSPERVTSCKGGGGGDTKYYPTYIKCM